MKTLGDDVFDSLIKELFDHWIYLPSDKVVFSPEVRTLCEQNSCGHYGKSWTCPPAIGPVDELREGLAPYDRFLLVDKVYSLKSGFDWTGMVESAKAFQSSMIRFKRQLKQSCPGLKYLALGAGACQRCPACTYVENTPCRYPEEALYSLEAYGINVMQTAMENNVTYNHGSETVTYMGGIFFQTS